MTSPDPAAVRLENVSRYFGDKRALGPVSAEIPRGGTVGFLGLNGVGKTTLLRILACDLRPSSGTVQVAGVDALADPHEVRKRVGYLPENPPLYQDMTVGDYLAFAGRLRGVAAGELGARVAAVEERTGTTGVHRQLVRHLSHGYRRRLGIAQALVHDPELLVLDEPTSGLDPVQVLQMRELVGELKGSHTILISSHILSEISQTCDRILVLDAGRVIASGSEQELSSGLLGAHRARVAVARPRLDDGTDAEEAEAIARLLRGLPGVSDVRRADDDLEAFGFIVESESDRRAELCRALVDSGRDILRLEPVRRELERLFMELIGGAGAPARSGGSPAGSGGSPARSGGNVEGGSVGENGSTGDEGGRR